MWTGLPFGAAASLVDLGLGGAAMCLIYRMLATRLRGLRRSDERAGVLRGQAAVIGQARRQRELALFAGVGALYAISAGWYAGSWRPAGVGLTRTSGLPMIAVVAALKCLRWRRHARPFAIRGTMLACGEGLRTDG